MILPLNNNYQIVSDPHCWVVQKKGRIKNKDTNKWETVWINQSYHRSIAGCVQRFIDNELRASDVKTWAGAAKLIKKLVTDLNKRLTPILILKEPVIGS